MELIRIDLIMRTQHREEDKTLVIHEIVTGTVMIFLERNRSLGPLWSFRETMKRRELAAVGQRHAIEVRA